MAKAKKTTNVSAEPTLPPDESPTVDIEMGPKPPSIPGARRPPVGRIRGSFFWIYGPEKIGKTTLASKFPGAWFWATEPGQNWVEVYEPTLIHSWGHFIEMCQFVEETKPTKFGDGKPIETLVIDTVDLLFKLCADEISGGDEGFFDGDRGKNWARLSNEFERVITKIRRWPYTLVCLSHSRQRPFNTKGRKLDRISPDIGAGGHRALSAATDLILYAHSDEYPEINDEGIATGQIMERRMLLCHPRAAIVAGGRMSHLLPEVIPLDYTVLNDYLTGKRKVGEEN